MAFRQALKACYFYAFLALQAIKNKTANDGCGRRKTSETGGNEK
jgi:hypothetical protein